MSDEFARRERAEKLTERVAELLHELWSKWFLHQYQNSTNENVRRWMEQAASTYSGLSESDKDKDRKLAQPLVELAMSEARKQEENGVAEIAKLQSEGNEIRPLRACHNIGSAPNTTLDAIAEDVRKWQRETFPAATSVTYRERISMEAEEFLREEESWNSGLVAWCEVGRELADLVICCIGYADRAGIDLVAAIAAKLEINRHRTWGPPDANGVQQHQPAAGVGLRGAR